MESLNRSRSLLTKVYNIKGHKLEDAYMKKNKVVVESKLQAAGTLLAACLEQLFSKVDKVPAGSFLIAKEKQPTKGNIVLPAIAGTITADQAAAHTGQTATVCGKVYETKYLNNGLPS